INQEKFFTYLHSSYQNEILEIMASQVQNSIVKELERRVKLFHEMSLSDILPNMGNLFILYLTIPVTTASAERSFSSLRQLKMYLRTTITDARVSNLGMLQIEKQAMKTYLTSLHSLPAERIPSMTETTEL
uniref:HAT C-terminal dimerisation domain-containing protein n=1 Tax=Crocodylus porosus TaxID=8502 RepID=A0A7M4F8T0_CROPO